MKVRCIRVRERHQVTMDDSVSCKSTRLANRPTLGDRALGTTFMVRGDQNDCFDPALAAFPTCRVPIERVVDPLAVSHAPERIMAYRQAMERGERFPPISVVRLAGRLLIADGHKRFSAYRSLAVTEIVVEVWTVRRWLSDQWEQFLRKTRQQWTLLWRSAVDHEARTQAVRLFWDTIGHWRRLGLSLARRFGR